MCAGIFFFNNLNYVFVSFIKCKNDKLHWWNLYAHYVFDYFKMKIWPSSGVINQCHYLSLEYSLSLLCWSIIKSIHFLNSSYLFRIGYKLLFAHRPSFLHQSSITPSNSSWKAYFSLLTPSRVCYIHPKIYSHTVI